MSKTNQNKHPSLDKAAGLARNDQGSKAQASDKPPVEDRQTVLSLRLVYLAIASTLLAIILSLLDLPVKWSNAKEVLKEPTTLGQETSPDGRLKNPPKDVPMDNPDLRTFVGDSDEAQDPSDGNKPSSPEHSVVSDVTNHKVTLWLPARMAGAKILLDKQSAVVLDRTQVTAEIEVPKKKGNSVIEVIREGARPCVLELAVRDNLILYPCKN